jgi:hypothetical protein
MAPLSALDRMKDELEGFAERLTPLLMTIVDLLLVRGDGLRDDDPDAYLAVRAENMLEHNWGKDLNQRIMDKLREHPRLNEVRSDIDAPK